MFVEFLTKNDFRDEYLRFFNARFTIGNMEMEDKKTDVSSPKRSMEFFTNMKAFNEILKANPDRISPYDLIDIANSVNNEQYGKGFRKRPVDVPKAKHFEPMNARYIPEAMYSLFKNYHEVWTDLDVYEREARLHIEIVRIQPFEDGNKRSARILTNFNLLKNNKAPIVIPASQTDEYFDYIDNYDVEGLAELFRQKSNEELDVMMNLYQKMNMSDSFVDVASEDSDIKLYKFVREQKKQDN